MASEKKPNQNRTPRKAVPTVRSTAGTGFDFEDRVTAWLLLETMAGAPVPGLATGATQFQMQVRPLRWSLDDILVTAIHEGTEAHLAISCKSNTQVTNTTLPADFVSSCWTQWFERDPNPFDNARDHLALVTRGNNADFMATWSAVKLAATNADAHLSIARIRSSAKQQKLFDSVKNPAKAAGFSVDDGEALALVRRMSILPVDFHIADSEHERAAAARARSLLADDSVQGGRAVWDALVAYAREDRLAGRTLVVKDVWHRLATSFDLLDNPNYKGQWQKLRAQSRDLKAQIEKALPTGLVISRQEEISRFASAFDAAPQLAVFGESGVGKSALVSSALDDCYPEAQQVWFSPEGIEKALHEIDRSIVGLNRPLLEVLQATTKRRNVLVLDAAERISLLTIGKVRSLIAALVGAAQQSGDASWHIVLVCQTSGWVSGSIRDLIHGKAYKNIQISTLPIESVKEALDAFPALAWLKAHDDAMHVLTNLRTLAWVVESAARFDDEEDASSLIGIADQLWNRWTAGKPSIHGLLIRLACREAEFEHSFAVSELPAEEASLLEHLPGSCPLRQIPSSRRIRFQHDLAADWARFQRLKEIWQETPKWIELAANPFWHTPIRMLGQFLLRERMGTRSAWDHAYERMQLLSGAPTIARDLLLDAIVLDTNSFELLSDRAEMLFAERGKQLLRLVRRFDHIATAPSATTALVDQFPDLSLYLEAQFRSPIPSRWVGMARFLSHNRQRVAEIASPDISDLCSRWLKGVPLILDDGAATPYRKDFAALALAVAREVQLFDARGTMTIGHEDVRVYRAALASALDLPLEVSTWALEMARRRPLSSEILLRAQAHRLSEAAAHQERLERDESYRLRHQRRERIPPSISSSTPLPPWELGPQGRVNGDFRDAVLHSSEFQILVQAASPAAGEVLLACLIEDEPEVDRSRRYSDDRSAGIAFDDQAYPTAPWKSPFLSFLRIMPHTGLETLLKLVNFSTDRWREARPRHEGITLLLEDGTECRYFGGHPAFLLSCDNSLFSGQLNCALAALEQFLCELVDADRRVDDLAELLLRRSSSTAVLGVLSNVAKHHPNLLERTLRPLLSNPEIYRWDSDRVRRRDSFFDGAAWLRGGKTLFEHAQAWANVPYKRVELRDIAKSLILKNSGVAEYMVTAIGNWPQHPDERDDLERRLLAAELDIRNYSENSGMPGEAPSWVFKLPEKLARELAKYNASHDLSARALLFPEQCRALLDTARHLKDEESEFVYSLLTTLSSRGASELDEELSRTPLVAAAVLLQLRAKDWLCTHTEAAQLAASVIIEALDEAGNDGTIDVHRGRSHLEFVAHYVAEIWHGEAPPEVEAQVLTILTSGDDQAVRVLFRKLRGRRAELKGSWWRLLFLALLWSGLALLRPRHGAAEVENSRWIRWRHWLRTRRLWSPDEGISKFQPSEIARRVQRLELRAWEREQVVHGVNRGLRRSALSGGLDTSVLAAAFDWLLSDSSTLVREEQEQRALVQALWAHQVLALTTTQSVDKDRYEIMPLIGYQLLEKIAQLVLSGPVDAANPLWEPVFDLGPKARPAVVHYLTAWFMLIKSDIDLAQYGARWRPMIEYHVREGRWLGKKPWYYAEEVERAVLGLDMSVFLERGTNHGSLIASLSDQFEAWARRRLSGAEDNLAAFCRFLASSAGKSIRLAGLRWISDALDMNADTGRWHRPATSEAFVAFLDILVTEHADTLVIDIDAREALYKLVALAVSRQLPAAQALEERIRRLR